MGNLEELKNLAVYMSKAYEDKVNQLTAIKVEAAELLTAFQMEKEGRSKEVSKMLESFRKKEAEISKQLEADLAKSEAERVQRIQHELEVRTTQISKLVEALKKEQAETAAAWQDLIATMQAKQGKRLVAEKTVSKDVEPVKDAEAMKEEVRAVSPRASTPLKEKVLSFINSHPGGVKVGDMEEPLGMARMRLGMVTKKLLEEGRVRKEKDSYFPAW